jgi:hypothetical protein
MAFGYVQGNSTQFTGVTSGGVALPAVATAGNLLVAAICNSAVTASGTFSFSGGGTWTTHLQSSQAASKPGLGVGSCPSATGGATTVTGAKTGAADDITVIVAEFTISSAPASFDQSASNNNTSAVATHSPGTTPATSAANELVIVADSHPNVTTTSVSATGFTFPAELVQHNSNLMPCVMGYKLDSGAIATQTASIVFNAADFYNAMILTWQEAPTGPPPPPPVQGPRTWQPRYRRVA